MRGALSGTRMRGTTRGSGSRVVVRVRKGKRRSEIGRVEDLAGLRVALDDGTTVALHLPEKVLAEPTIEAPARWSELAEDPRFAALRAKPPRADDRLELERIEIPDGVPIELLVTEEEHAFEEPTALRGAPERRRVGVTARAIAFGDDAAARMDRIVSGGRARRRRPEQSAVPSVRQHWRPGLIGGPIAAALLCAGCVAGRTPAGIDLASIAITMLLVLGAQWVLDHLPRFVGGTPTKGDKPLKQPWSMWPMAVAMVAGSIYLPVLEELLPLAPAPQPLNASPLAAIILGASSLALFVAVVLGRRESVRLLRRLARARPLLPRGPLDGVWGSVAGTVRDPTPVNASMSSGTVASAIVHVVEETVVSGSDPNIYVERVLSEGTFFVDTDAGAFEVDPSGGRWASDARVVMRRGGKDAKRVDHVQVIPIGGSVVVAAYARRGANEPDGHLAVEGPESLVMFAARRGQDARATVERLLFARNVAIVAIILGGCLAAIFGTVAQRDLPAFYMRPGD